MSYYWKKINFGADRFRRKLYFTVGVIINQLFQYLNFSNIVFIINVDFFFPPFKRGIQLYRYYILCIGLKHIVSIDKTCFTLGYFFWRIVYLRNEPKKFIQIALVYMKWECHCEIYLIDYCKLSFHF